MVRESISDEWREVAWDEAIGTSLAGCARSRPSHGAGSIGGITSSRCTNEEVYVVQKMVRAAFGNNNVDTCARVCHSPTGYGLKQTFGTSAGTQDFRSVDDADVIVVIGANPTDGHPVFASRMKRRLRRGAKLIVVDPRRIDLVRSPHIEAAHHLQLAPGTNVAVVNAMAHVVVTEDLLDAAFVAERCEGVQEWAAFIAAPEHSPEAVEEITGVPAAELRAAARLYAQAPNAAIYYGLGVTEHSQGSTMVMGMANLAMATGNIGRSGVGVEPAARAEQRAGLLRHGLVPARAARLPARLRRRRPRGLRGAVGARRSRRSRGCGSRTCSTPRSTAPSAGCSSRARTSPSPTRTPRHVHAALAALDLVVVQDLFLNETAQLRARVPARHVVPGEGRHLHQRRAPDQPGPPGDALHGPASTSGRSSASSPRRWATR